MTFKYICVRICPSVVWTLLILKSKQISANLLTYGGAVWLIDHDILHSRDNIYDNVGMGYRKRVHSERYISTF